MARIKVEKKKEKDDDEGKEGISRMKELKATSVALVICAVYNDNNNDDNHRGRGEECDTHMISVLWGAFWCGGLIIGDGINNMSWVRIGLMCN